MTLWNRARTIAAAATLAVVVGMSPGAAPAQDSTSPSVEPAITKPYKKIELRLKAQGILKEVKVKEGDTVKVGDVLMVLDDNEERLEWEAAKAESDSDVTVRAAQANYEVKQAKADKIKKFNDENNVGGDSLELKEALSDAKVAQLSIEKEQQDLKIKKIKTAKLAAQLENMQLKSRINGKVQSVDAHEGELIDASKPR